MRSNKTTTIREHSHTKWMAAVLLGLASLIAWTTTAAAGVVQQQIESFPGALLEDFGYAVALAGDVLVVGDPNAVEPDYEPGNGGWPAGAAFVYRFNGTQWVPEQRLRPQLARHSELNQLDFGANVAIEGGRIVVSAPSQGTDEDSVYVFVRSGSSWAQEAVLTATSPYAKGSDNFGGSIDISGDRIAVGASRFDYGPGATDCGTVYVYRRNGSSWALEEQVLSTLVRDDDRYGADISLSGDVLAVAAPYTTDDTSDYGAIFVHRFDGSTWHGPGKITRLVAANAGATMYPQSTFPENIGLNESGTKLIVTSNMVHYSFEYDGYQWYGGLLFEQFEFGLLIDHFVYEDGRFLARAVLSEEVKVLLATPDGTGGWRPDMTVFSAEQSNSERFLTPGRLALSGKHMALGVTILNQSAATNGMPESGVLVLRVTQCSNGLDEDGDGLVDLADPDCQDEDDDAEWLLQKGQIVVTDNGPAARVLRIDPATGEQTVLSEGAPLRDLYGVELTSTGDIYLADGNGRGLYRLDSQTGAVAQITFLGDLYMPRYISTEADGSIVVADSVTDSILRVDPETGAQTFVSRGGNLTIVIDVEVEDDGQLVATDYASASVVRIDPTTGQQSIVSSYGQFSLIWDLEIDGQGDYLLSDTGNGTLFHVAHDTGAQTAITSFADVRGIAIEEDGHVLVADPSLDTLWRVDPSTGVAAALSSGGEIDFPMGVDVAPVTYVPEPSVMLGLFAGVALLPGLTYHRSRRAQARAD